MAPFRVLALLLLLPAAALGADGRADLTTGWRIQSSAKAGAGGDVISTREFVPAGWTEATVPTTVVAAQLAAGQFEDPFFAKNLRKLPGATYPVAVNFAHLPMPADSPYASSWWYRTEFRVPAAFAGRRVRIHFDGINYRANVWLNGRKIAGSDDVAGAYRTYEFDVTGALSSDAANVLAVETFAPTEHDLAINWVDWSPMPPDKEMGLWGDVYLTASGPVAIRYPFVTTRFADEKLRRADLTVAADLVNTTDRPVEGVLEATIGVTRIEQPVSLAPGERRTVRFTPDRFANLRVDDPKVWWPAPLGPQNLDTLALTFTAYGAVSDTASVRFGIREVTSELTPKGHRLFRINRKPILIRGAGWAPDMFLRRPSPERLRTELEYVRDMNLNTVRLEGKMESDAFYDACDQMGILVMAGWCCCDHWEMWDKWKPGDLAIATASLRSQTLRLRPHPSALVWLNGSDNPPPPDVEKAYIKELDAASWPNPYISNATATPTTVTGPSGVKMEGPYDYVTPSYWLRDVKYGGAFGFATEIGPGPAIPTAGSLRRMLPKEHLWPIDDVWNFHAGGQEFKTLHIFNSAMRKSYGEPANFDDYVDKAQAMTYDSERAMFEAYGKNKYTSTGVIQWMLNNSWPSLIWHLYDYYLQPAGGYYGTKKACEPLHIQYGYDDRSVVVVNSLYQGFTGLRATAKVYDFDLRETFSNEATVDAPEDTSRPAFAIPAKALAGGGVHFVRLELRDNGGRVVSTNFYWLPAAYATYAWQKTTFVNTPMKTYENLTALSRLPNVEVETTARADGDRIEVRLRNTGAHLAFQVHATVLAGEGREEVAPIFWNDNYVTLMPGETRVLTARIARQSGPLAIGLDGMNIGTRAVALAAGEGH